MGEARTTEGVLATVAALVPAVLAAERIAGVPDAARDAEAVRVLGLGPSAWRGLDTAIELLAQPLPVGTRAARAAFGGAIAAAVAGALLFAVARTLLEACAPTRRLGPLIAAIAVVTPLAGGAWQAECSSIGGAATGALLVLLPLALLGRRAPGVGSLRATAAALGLAVGYGPAVGACALAGASAVAATDPDARRLLAGGARRGASLGFALALGLAPLGLGLARARAAGATLVGSLASGWAVEGVARVAPAPAAAWASEMGVAMIVFALVGAALAALVPRARPIAAGLAAVAVAGAICARALPAAPSHVAPPLLAALAAGGVLGAVGLQALVRFVASAKVPMARASAAMVVVLELVLPVDTADETLARPAPAGTLSAWDDVAWGELPPEAVLLLAGEPAWQRAEAARAQGSLRADVAVLSLDAPSSGPSTQRALGSDPALLPLWRDVELSGAPSEASLAAVAAVRPVLLAYQPRWGRALAAHLVPDALLDRFELEPRGASDRRAALAAFGPRRQRLARLARGDVLLDALSARLLAARALLFATLDPRDADAIGAAIADVRAFEPGDPLASEILARLGAKGPARFDDLQP
jgi:hypothetical protein